jgi:hypothetical protein
MYNVGGNILELQIHELRVKIWDEEEIPKDWRQSIIYPIHKKRDKLNSKNYRGSSLLCTAYKIFTNILAEETTGEYHTGFRHLVEQQLQLQFTVRLINGKFCEHILDLYEIFIDFRQAYDCILI